MQSILEIARDIAVAAAIVAALFCAAHLVLSIVSVWTGSELSGAHRAAMAPCAIVVGGVGSALVAAKRGKGPFARAFDDLVSLRRSLAARIKRQP